jgi:hypothetical protein
VRYPDITEEVVRQALTEEEKESLVETFFEIDGRYEGEVPEKANLLKSIDLAITFNELLLRVFGPSMRRQ